MSRPGYIDRRGNNQSRARRRAWLLTEFNPELGPGRARCHLKLLVDCVGVVDEVTLSVDRKEPGGSYARHNIQPACRPCNDYQGGLLGLKTYADLHAEYLAAREQWEIEFQFATNKDYYPGIIEVERRKERRGGRREVTDYIDEFAPPVWRDWLVEWHAARRNEAEAV